MKTTHSPVVSKIDNRLEQYTSAAQVGTRPPSFSRLFLPLRRLKSASLSPQRENKESRSPRSGAVDLPVVTDSIRNIKSMWEKGSVFSSPGGGGGQFKVKGAAAVGGRLAAPLAPDIR